MSSNKINFSNNEKVVIITGGSGAIGSSIAKSFALEGANVIILGTKQEKINAVLLEIEAYSSKSITGLECNVLSKSDLTNTRDIILKKFGRIDVLINVAGGNVAGATQTEEQSVFDLEIENIDAAIDLNLQGTIYPSLIFGKAIAESGKGSIINISSMATYSAITRVMSYSVAKSGVNTFTEWFASEMARKFGDKVRVNAIAPGFFIGEQNRKLLLNPDGSLTSRSVKVINKTPMGRFGQVEELNGAIHFLCSDAASFITGVILPVDGGFSSNSGV
jgi:NAD(P)-dependent dehydrogenase (short-subunit alcohol dehydrogenase family)